MSANLIEFSLTFQTSFSRQRKFGYAHSTKITIPTSINEQQFNKPNYREKSTTPKLACFSYNVMLENAIAFCCPTWKKKTTKCHLVHKHQLSNNQNISIIIQTQFCVKNCVHFFVFANFPLLLCYCWCCRLALFFSLARLFGREILFSLKNKIVKLK